MRFPSKLMCGLALLATPAGTAVALEASSASAQDQATAQRVIVVLKDQDSGTPATPRLFGRRRSAFQAAQAPVVAQMNHAGARNVTGYTVVDAVSATVSPSEQASLKSDPAVSEVVPDGQISLGSPLGGQRSSSTPSTPTATCPADASNGRVELDPQALQTIGADSERPGAPTARSLGITGAGVKVAFIADGLNVNDPDFIRPDGQHVFVDYKDFSGDGTGSTTPSGEAFLDSSSIAAQGREVYDISGQSALGSTQPCRIRVEGVAPGASLEGLDVFGDNSVVYDSTFLEAINYAVKTNVNVLNESLGGNLYPDDQASLDVIKQANDAAIAAGVTVTASAGDAGLGDTIGTPATDPEVIDAGASTTFRGYEETDYQGFDYPGVHGYLNDNISGLSSSGFEQDGQTVDLVAPGDLNWALCSPPETMYTECNNQSVQLTGGTSEAAPLTAGVAALVIQAYRESHDGVTPSPAEVKALIVSNTDDIGAPADQQGSGRLDADEAVVAALHAGVAGQGGHGGGPTGHGGHPWGGDSTPVTTDSLTQLHATDAPGAGETLQDTITNSGAHRERLFLATRTLGAYRTIDSQTVTLANGDPQLVDETGTSNNLQTVHFTVDPGQNRLDVSDAFQASSAYTFDTVPQVTLIDPAGRYAAYNLPQGNGDYDDIQVTDPAPGQWTALVYAPDAVASGTGAPGGFTGPVAFQARTAADVPFGSVSPSSVSLAPGQSQDVTLHVSTPASPGDASGAIVVSGAGPGANGSDSVGEQAGPTAVTTIPVTLRSVIPSGSQSFTDDTTGGNGRSTVNGETFYYGLDVPSGAPEVDADIALKAAQESGYPFSAWLVDPSGIAEAYTTNASLPAPLSTTEVGTQTATESAGGQLHVLSPTAGEWTLIVDFGPTAGGRLSEPFTVSTADTAVPANAGGLPDSTMTTLAAGKPVTYDVRVTNTGPAPESFFPDARLGGATQVTLGAVAFGASVPVPNNTADLPTYLVPTDSTSLTAEASTTGTTPISFDTAPGALGEAELGDPDIISTTGTTAVASFSAQVLTQGGWGIAPNVAGVFGATGAPGETVDTSMSVVTAPFDAAVSARTGDLEYDGTKPSLLSSFAPVTVPAGQTATIPVTVTPTGAVGAHVTGTLYLDDYVDSALGTYGYPDADQVAEIPYSYTVR